MKILMFGRGVISAAYGWALEKAGHTVHFYVREGRAEQYGDLLQVNLIDTRQGFFSQPTDEAWRVTLLETISPDHDYDLIILSVQHYNFEQATTTLATFVGNASVLIFNNFWVEPQEAISMLPADQLVWGFPAAGGGIDSNALRGSLFGSVTFGTFGQPLTQRERAVRETFTQSGFTVKEEDDFRAWLLIHFAQNAAIHSEFLLPEHKAKPVHSVTAFYNIALNAKELIPLLEARDINIKAHSSAVAFRIPAAVSCLIMWLSFKFLAPVRKTVEAHFNPRELTHTCLDVLEDAKRREVAVPRLESKQLAGFFELN